MKLAVTKIPLTPSNFLRLMDAYRIVKQQPLALLTPESETT
jgi:hypothetical protein